MSLIKQYYTTNTPSQHLEINVTSNSLNGGVVNLNGVPKERYEDSTFYNTFFTNTNSSTTTDTNNNNDKKECKQVADQLNDPNILMYSQDANTSINCLNQKHELFTTKSMRDYTLSNHVHRNDELQQASDIQQDPTLLIQTHQSYNNNFTNNPYHHQHYLHPSHASRHQQDMYTMDHYVTNTTPLSHQFNTNSDYILKYEKPEQDNHHTSYTTGNEDDNEVHNSYTTPSFNDSNKEKNYMKHHQNNSILENYGNSVFDSPLSLTTSNDDICNSIMTTLTTSRDFNRLHTSNTNTLLNKNSMIDSSTQLISLSNRPHVHTHATHDSKLSNQIESTTAPTKVKAQNTNTDNSFISNSSKQSNSNNVQLADTTTIQTPQHQSSTSKNGRLTSLSSLNDTELISLPLRELNKRLRYMPKPAAVDLKKRRRTLKNRKYAQNCRSKRLEQKCEIELQNIHLRSELNRLQKSLVAKEKEIERINKEKYLLKTYIEQLTKDQSKFNINQHILENLNKNTMIDSMHADSSSSNYYTDLNNNISPSTSSVTISTSNTMSLKSSPSSTLASSQDLNY